MNSPVNKVTPSYKVMDGNEAAASVAYRCNDVIGIYPITPSSPMSEACEVWESQGKTNIRGQVPRVIEMQSEGGAAGTVHGALLSGAMTTTFTSSQGLLLKIPNMYKIAGELTPFVMHVAARTLATHALSIFGDHSDVMAARQTGFAMLSSASVQQAHDFALISQAATLNSRIPFMHFFDGFRTSHEVNKIAAIDDETIKAMIDQKAVDAFVKRGMTPDSPSIHGTAQNPDTFFQQREAANLFHQNCPDIVAEKMALFAKLTGREYKLFDYYGHPQASDVVVVMGSASTTVQQAVDKLLSLGRKVGVISVHLYRPFSLEHFVEVLPESVKKIAVLDRTKEPGALGEPLYLDVLSALQQSDGQTAIRIMGGRYGLSSKEFNPDHARSVFDAMDSGSLHHNFTVGINDDVTHLSIPVSASIESEPASRVRALFYGLGSDGTVSANKNTIKIIGENTPLHAQGYFVYDSKKSGGTTVSHLRFDETPIEASYLIQQADYIACHQFQFVAKSEIFEQAAEAATLLLNSPYSADDVWSHLSADVQQIIIDKRLKLYVINAAKLAYQLGLKKRQNTIMQTAFFALSQLLPMEQAISQLKSAIEKSYAKAGRAVVEANWKAVDETLSQLEAVVIPSEITRNQLIATDKHSEELPHAIAMMIADKGDLLPVSAFSVDGVWPTATSQWEKRDIASEIPCWSAEACTQCNICSLVCPHAAIRAKAVAPEALESAPEGFQTVEYMHRDFKGSQYTLQVSPEDCTGCGVCTQVCPANKKQDALVMVAKETLQPEQSKNFEFFQRLPELERTNLKRIDGRSSQLLQPLFEYSGACSGCGETPYIKLLTQLFGDRLMIANATGCSSIYGGNLPTTPYCKDDNGRGPAWANSLFEDNAEFGLGMRLAMDSRRDYALQHLETNSTVLSEQQIEQITQDAFDISDEAVNRQRQSIAELKEQTFR